MIKSLSKIHPAPPPFLDHDYPFFGLSNNKVSFWFGLTEDKLKSLIENKILNAGVIKTPFVVWKLHLYRSGSTNRVKSN